MAFNKVVPGKAENYGMGDRSGTVTAPTMPSSPAHYTVLSLPTPKGELGMKFIDLGDLTSLYGDVTDVNTPYYNAISALIQMMSDGGQSTVGIRRVTANTVIARVAVAVAVTPNAKVPQYMRNTDGTYQIDQNGARIPDADKTIAGYDWEVVLIDMADATTGEYGALKIVTVDVSEGVKKTIYPLFELPAGIGDAYNRMGFQAGHDASTDWSSIASFVETYGVMPFGIKMYEKTKTGVPVYAQTQDTSALQTDFTLFNMRDENNLRYSLSQAVGAFTGNNVNRPHVVAAAPFYEAKVYQANIETVCRLLYQAEAAVEDSELVIVEGVQPFYQMNPLSLVNHKNIPYYAVNDQSKVSYFNLSTYMDAAGGISPFLTKDLKTPVPVAGTYEFDPAKNHGVSDSLNTEDAWTVTQALILPDILTYASSLETQDYTRNRQSMIWDVGYDSDIKDALIALWNSRKDICLVMHAGYWLKQTTQAQRYSLMESLTTKLRLYPESARYGTPAARAMVNLWDGKIINEATGLDFPLTLDLAYVFAQFGGASTGVVAAVNSPDHGGNRVLTKMYDPTVEFEADNPASNNFNEGALSVRPYNESEFYRPALPTVYGKTEPVLKDFMTVFTAVCIEKILQDTWNLVSGDTTITAETYLATVKDEAEAECRRRLGSMFTRLNIETFYDETSPNSRSVMRATAHVWFRKGKYMMDMDLLAYNEQDDTSTTA